LISTSRQLQIFSSLAIVRELCMEHLNIGQSVIPYDILTTVFLYELQGKNITIKELFLKLPFSDMGIRYHLKSLIDDGWIEVCQTNEDRRVREIRSQAKLKQEMSLLAKRLNEIFPPQRVT